MCRAPGPAVNRGRLAGCLRHLDFVNLQNVPPLTSPRPAHPPPHEILAAAVKLLREEGGKALTTSRVAKAAGMPQGHLTYYFPRRADLLVAVARRSLEVAARDVIAHVEKGGGDKPDDLRRAARAG